jgi:ABC-type uncharacterized transport system permease subunit
MSILQNGLAALAYAGVGAACVARGRDRPLAPQWLALALCGWLLHGFALVWAFAQGEPRFGWSLALSITGWMLVAIYGVENRVLQNVRIPAEVWWFASAVCVLVVIAPPTIAPAAGDSVLFTAHWVFGLAAYGLMAAALVHGILLWRSERQLQVAKVPGPIGAGSGELPLMALEKLMVRLTWAGFAMLSVTVLLGTVLRERLSGRPFKADHETVFSLLAWAVFAGLLLANRLLGLRGKRAVKWLVAGSVLLLLGYVGSRFVLAVLLGRA